jgi:hypothetical protein
MSTPHERNMFFPTDSWLHRSATVHKETESAHGKGAQIRFGVVRIARSE